MRRMRAWVVLGCLVALGAGAEGTAERVMPRTVVSMEPLPLFTGIQLPLAVDHAFGERVMGTLGVGLTAYGQTSRGSPGAGLAAFVRGQSWGMELKPGVRWFLVGRAPEGLWVNPEVRLGLAAGRADAPWNSAFLLPGSGVVFSPDAREWSVGGGLLAGYTVLLGEHLTVSAGAGLRVDRVHSSLLASFDVQQPSSRVTLDRVTWGGQTRLSVGYAF